MSLFSSLTNRIFVATAALAVLAIAIAVYQINVAVTAQAENELRRGLEEAGMLVEEHRTTLFDHFSREARLVADLPVIKAAMATGHPPTVQPIAEAHHAASRLTCSWSPIQAAAYSPRPAACACRSAMRSSLRPSVRPRQDTKPRRCGPCRSRPAGRLRTELHGTGADGNGDGRIQPGRGGAARFKALTNSEIAFALRGRVQASTLDARLQRASDSVDRQPDRHADRTRRQCVRRRQPSALARRDRRGPAAGDPLGQRIDSPVANGAAQISQRRPPAHRGDGVPRRHGGHAPQLLHRANDHEAAWRDHRHDAPYGRNGRSDATHFPNVRKAAGRTRTRASWRRRSTR